MMPSEFRHCYGVAGVNYPARQHKYNGQMMNVLASFAGDAMGQQLAHEYRDEFGDVAAQVEENGTIFLLAPERNDQ